MAVRTWTKHYRREELQYQWHRDLAFLSILHPYHGFPKILGAKEKEEMTMTWCGYSLAKAVEDYKLPLDVVILQYRGLLVTLAELGIRHRDLTVHNMLWHPDSGAHIVDFGLAIMGEENNVVPEAYHPTRWRHCEMEDWEQIVSVMWELKTKETYTKEMWDKGERPWTSGKQ